MNQTNNRYEGQASQSADCRSVDLELFCEIVHVNQTAKMIKNGNCTYKCGEWEGRSMEVRLSKTNRNATG